MVKNKKTSITSLAIILDIDETLVRTTDYDISERNKLLKDKRFLSIRKDIYSIQLYDVLTPKGSGVYSEYWGIDRPHLHEILSFFETYFKYVIVWSAGQKRYVEAMVETIFRDHKKPDLVFTHDDVEYIGNRGDYYKPIDVVYKKAKEMGMCITPKNTLFLDDKKSNFIGYESNGIIIPKFKPTSINNILDRTDIALLQLKQWLITDEVMMSSDIRKVNKQHIFTSEVEKTTKELKMIYRDPFEALCSSKSFNKFINNEEKELLLVA